MSDCPRGTRAAARSAPRAGRRRPDGRRPGRRRARRPGSRSARCWAIALEVGACRPRRRRRASGSCSDQSGASSGQSTSGSSCAVCSSSARRCCGRTSSWCSGLTQKSRFTSVAASRSPAVDRRFLGRPVVRASPPSSPRPAARRRRRTSLHELLVRERRARARRAPPNELPTSAAGRCSAAASTNENGSVGSGVLPPVRAGRARAPRARPTERSDLALPEP